MTKAMPQQRSKEPSASRNPRPRWNNDHDDNPFAGNVSGSPFMPAIKPVAHSVSFGYGSVDDSHSILSETGFFDPDFGK